MSPHLNLAHKYWKDLLNPGDIAIDATCGNGHDSAVLADLILTPDSGELYCIDIQKAAIENTKKRLKDAPKHVHYIQESHVHLPTTAPKLIVYNLGYLPGGDKSVITIKENTLQSIKKSLEILTPNGALSITCYPGHPGGLEEQQAIFAWASSLNPYSYECCIHSWPNRPLSPSLLIIKNITI